jgi:hypothetical protein
VKPTLLLASAASHLYIRKSSWSLSWRFPKLDTHRLQPTACGGFVQRELDRVATLLLATTDSDYYARLYVPQQALSWALDPETFAAPSAVISPPVAIDTQAS